MLGYDIVISRLVRYFVLRVILFEDVLVNTRCWFINTDFGLVVCGLFLFKFMLYLFFFGVYFSFYIGNVG